MICIGIASSLSLVAMTHPLPNKGRGREGVPFHTVAHGTKASDYQVVDMTRIGQGQLPKGCAPHILSLDGRGLR